MQLYLSYRDGDAPGFALHFGAELAKLSPGTTLVTAPVGRGAAKPVPKGAIVLLLVGTRWLRDQPGGPVRLAASGDAQRALLEQALKNGTVIVPLLFGADPWDRLCAELPSTLRPLTRLNAVPIRPQSFAADVADLLTRLGDPRRGTPWTETAARTVVRVETTDGGVLQWWTGRDKTLRVFVDGAEVGALTAFDGHFDADVEPGRHAVQLREGPLFKSDVVEVTVGRGATVTLVCHRNSFTGVVSLARRR